MNILKEFRIDDKCSYLADKKQSMHYKVINDCTVNECQEFVERGFRRFGRMFFRPLCEGCDECQSIKIDVKNFKFSKSQRRVLKKAEHIKSYIKRPSMSKEHLELFDKYHQYMKDKKGWEYSGVDAKNYYSSFVDAHHDFGYEILYYDENKLIGIDLIDVLEDGISSIYFYYDPDYTKYSLGKLSLYNQILYAQNTNKSWIYLGYYVKECPSLSYKSHYKPYLTLEGKPRIDEDYIYN
jgi:arginine-tRNA-protein transferase